MPLDPPMAAGRPVCRLTENAPKQKARGPTCASALRAIRVWREDQGPGEGGHEGPNRSLSPQVPGSEQ